MKTCQNCGVEMEQDALFCRECGTRLNNEKSDIINTELSRIIDLSLRDDNWDSRINILLSPCHYQNTAAQLIIERENGVLSICFNVGMELSNTEDKELLTKLRQSSYLTLFKPDDGYDINKGDLYGIIDFGPNIEKAKSTLSSLLRDVYSQGENDTLGYLIEKDGNEVECSASYKVKSNNSGKSCMGVVLLFVTATALLASILL